MLGYDTFTPIQKEVIPLLLEKKNIVVQAKTGSGKTCSFALPLCEQIDWNKNRPQALILACTRELVNQIQEECALIGKMHKIKVQAIYGKEKMENQIALLKQKCHILVATPGRLMDLIERGAVDLSLINTLIIDEADYMLDLGFLEKVKEICKYLDKDVQKALFSATYPDRIENFISEFIEDYEKVEVQEEVQIEHYYNVSEDPLTSLKNFLGNLSIESALVFCERKEEVDNVYDFLKTEGFRCAKLHGDLLQKQRFQQLNAFKSGKKRILIASDVAARGIDIDKVSHVFHYGKLHNFENYIHRSGRSARKDEKGISIILLSEITSFYKQLIQKFNIKEISGYSNSDVKKIEEINKPIHKNNKNENFMVAIEKIYINAGSEKKIRANDIIGALCSLPEVSAEDIGVIEVLRQMTYVEIYHNKAKYIVENMKGKTVKKKKVRIELAK